MAILQYCTRRSLKIVRNTCTVQQSVLFFPHSDETKLVKKEEGKAIWIQLLMHGTIHRWTLETIHHCISV